MHQVQAIRSVIGRDFRIFYGCLGQGIVGVCQGFHGVMSQAVVEAPSFIKNQWDAEEHTSSDKLETQSEHSDACASTAPVPSDLKCGPEQSCRAIGIDGTPEEGAAVFLFVNLSDYIKHCRNGTAVGGYTCCLDMPTRVLRWQSQRRDKRSVTARRVVQWVEKGGRLEVFARSSLAPFIRLGDVGSMQLEIEAHCLLRPGMSAIQEQGGTIVHKAINPNCLNAALRSGVGLCSVIFKDGAGQTLCKSCCFSPAVAVITFSAFTEEGMCLCAELLGNDLLAKSGGKRQAKKPPSTGQPEKKRPSAKQISQPRGAKPDRLKKKESVVKVEPGAHGGSEDSADEAIQVPDGPEPWLYWPPDQHERSDDDR